MFEKRMFGLSKNGTYKVWNIGVFHIHGGDLDKDGAAFTITHGSEGGKLTSKTEYVNEGKQGRTPYEQAVLQAEARFKKQYDKNYRETKEELNEIPVLAVLAKDHTKVGKDSDIEKGVLTSDKLDGCRLLAFCKRVDGVKTVYLNSRTGQVESLPHITTELLSIMNVGDIYDGEAYLHGYKLQEICSAVQRTDTQAKIDECIKKLARVKAKYEKNPSEELSHDVLDAEAALENAYLIHDLRPRLEFHVFDVIINGNLDIPFLNRAACLKDEGLKFPQVEHIKEVCYKYADSIQTLTEQLNDAIDRGYEGIMYRLPEGVYESGKRSSYLFKFKLFFDEEFMILRTHKDKQGFVVFELINNVNTEEFKCVMGDYNWRRAVANDDFRGQWMTVKFQARNKGTLLPQFGTGKAIRQGTVVDGIFIPSL
jgi:DNA ligase-1